MAHTTPHERLDAFRAAYTAQWPQAHMADMVSMKPYTSLNLGGPAQLMAQPTSQAEIICLLTLAKAHEIPVTIIGNGSNLLVKDGGIPGLVIRIGPHMAQIERTSSGLKAQAGVHLTALSSKAAQEGLSGLAFASGIPGTLGGAVYMNAGAYGGEMSQVVAGVDGVSLWGEPLHYSVKEMAFGYRQSRAQRESMILTYVDLALAPGDVNQIQADMREFNQRRREKQPLTVPSAGSTFKRPQGYYAGTLIEQCGLKGTRVGGAQVSEKHAGFLTNAFDGTAADFIALIALVQQRVYEKTGVHLEAEVRIIGEDSPIRPA